MTHVKDCPKFECNIYSAISVSSAGNSLSFTVPTDRLAVVNFSSPAGNYQLTSGPEVIKIFSCATQLSMEFFLLRNVKMPTNVGILTFMSGKNSILGLSGHFYTSENLKFHAQLS